MRLIRVVPVLGLLGVVLAASAGLGAGTSPYAALALIRPRPPRPAQAFTVPTPDGGTVSLARLRGKVVFLNFWATWCPPCREEMPAMQRLHERFRPQGLEILALSLDADTDLVVPFLQERGLTFPVGLDPQMRVAALYRVTGLPATFLIDRKGRIVAQALGPRQWNGTDAHAVLEELLAAP